LPNATVRRFYAGSEIMEPAIGNLQFTWSHPGQRDRDVQTKRDDYFVELVEHVTAVTPEIDRVVGQALSRHSPLSNGHGHGNGTPHANGGDQRQG
jgi:hypothetical protein